MLNDTDPFPFGKHKGVVMQSVPASYLDWFHDQSWISSWPEVLEYIERNRKVIDKELEENG